MCVFVLGWGWGGWPAQPPRKSRPRRARRGCGGTAARLRGPDSYSWHTAAYCCPRRPSRVVVARAAARDQAVLRRQDDGHRSSVAASRPLPQRLNFDAEEKGSIYMAYTPSLLCRDEIAPVGHAKPGPTAAEPGSHLASAKRTQNRSVLTREGLMFAF